VLWGAAYGRNDGPSEDGEVAAHDSTNVSIYHSEFYDIGASAIYYVNCDSCNIEGTTVYSAGEWGLDIVSGSDNVTVTGNYVQGSYNGGAVFDEANSTGGTFTSNTFVSNRTSGSWGSTGPHCNGINIGGAVSGVTLSGNTANPSPVTCTPWN